MRIQRGGAVTALAFSAHSRYLAVGSEDKTATVVDVISGNTMVRLPGISGRVTSIAYSHDNKLIAVGSTSQEVSIVAFTSNQDSQIVHKQKYGGNVHSVAFSSDDDFVAVGSDCKGTEGEHYKKEPSLEIFSTERRNLLRV